LFRILHKNATTQGHKHLFEAVIVPTFLFLMTTCA